MFLVYYIITMCLGHGANQNQISSENTSLLHHAAIEGHVPVAAKLLELGAQVT
jgi:ankyrin repeat protein